MKNGAPKYVLSGRRDDFSANLINTGSAGYYWSSTTYNSCTAYYMYIDSSRVEPRNPYTRYHGFTVRCIAR